MARPSLIVLRSMPPTTPQQIFLSPTAFRFALAVDRACIIALQALLFMRWAGWPTALGYVSSGAAWCELGKSRQQSPDCYTCRISCKTVFRFNGVGFLAFPAYLAGPPDSGHAGGRRLGAGVGNSNWITNPLPAAWHILLDYYLAIPSSISDPPPDMRR